MDIDWDNDSNATLPTDQHQDQDPFLALACYVGSWLGTFSTEWWKKEKSDRFRQLMINAPATDKSKEPSACWTTRFDCDTGRFTLIWWINSWILSCQASLRCRFLNKLENNAQNPDQRTSVTVSLRVVSTCWPWPSCCPTRIAVLRVTWWLGLAWKCWDTQEKTSFCPMSTWSQAWHVRCLLHVQTARSQGSRRHHDDSWLGTFGNPS